ncbi:MAG: alpha/beta fold hydrolase [Holophaga sp.]|nr:alpha/beta fold hydrolase [Holophaga sp.]
MSMGPGILLIHGYTGSPADFGALPEALAATCPDADILKILLPGHPATAPAFDKDAFLNAIREAAITLTNAGRKLILVGHSTGGVLALAALAEGGLQPDLVVLAAVPKRIDGHYLPRWSAHSEASAALSFTDMARMVACINAIGAQAAIPCPVLILQGEADDLVPSREASLWRAHFKPGAARAMFIPGAGHHLFKGTGCAFAYDAVQRAVRDAAHELSESECTSLLELQEDEPEVGAFLTAHPTSARHLANCPSARGLSQQPLELGLKALSEPIFANIEITTRCNLRCVFCARTHSGRPAAEMSLETFRRILDLLPHAYRITLVGLGEPLLHPQVADFVAEAKALGRRIALVTNAHLLNPEYGKALLDAGLDGITFSLDAPTAELAEQVRAGTDLNRAVANIKAFNALAQQTRPLARAVFSAVSTATLPHLEELVQLVAGLGVDVLMLSDLNFPQNLAQTLWQNPSPAATATVRQAIRTAFALRLPTLTVRSLEAFALRRNYQQHLLVPPTQLYTRSIRRTHCESPWQTLPIAVDGTITCCDCQPDQVVGNLLEQPFSELWQQGVLAHQRRQMLSDTPPEACRICPRF